ncbi:MAG TPA: phosphoglycerate kinase [Candidatus Paceibacterota bacterium]
MRFVKDIGDIKGKTILLHLDLNVEILGNEVADDFRIKKSMPLIDFLRNKGANLIFASHIDPDPETSLRPVFEYLKKQLPVVLLEDYFPEAPDLNVHFAKGNIVLLENLRKYKEEKENDENFARHLASFADFFVNEAFSISHRKHASIVGIPKYLPSFAGFAFEEEMVNLSRAFSPPHPFLFVLGGAKFDTKLPLLKRFFNLADSIFIGGALANDFLKARGYSVGKSLVSTENINLDEFPEDKLIMPIDVVVKNSNGLSTKKIEEVIAQDCIVDVGLQSVTALYSTIENANFILWNGPLGNYEEGFKQATLTLAKKIAEASATSIVGGGDTIASIAELGLGDKFSFISTGGGAMLEFLANETLPGIEALG